MADAKTFHIEGWMDEKAGGSRSGERTTWVAGNRPIEELDEASRKILAAGGQGQEASGTSIFDPVLCELCYRWFSPKGGTVIDPFAGGSVRGIVAAKLGRKYRGIDLRPEQIAANESQAAKICAGVIPQWTCGDSRIELPKIPPGDMIFSCPPYGDLEVYSDDPRDLSTMGWPKFLACYREIINQACMKLCHDRFAVFVVGDFRDDKGNYRNFPGETTAAFLAAGLKYYNEAILVTAVGSLPIRAGLQFDASRKLGKTHQNILVYVKGDPQAAARACKIAEEDLGYEP